MRHIHAREASISELSEAHTQAHIRNYCPNDDDFEEDPNPRAHKITSIAALLNTNDVDPIDTGRRKMVCGEIGIGTLVYKFSALFLIRILPL